jgi:hypothetical protein
MIALIEVPHQRPAFIWFAKDDDDAVLRGGNDDTADAEDVVNRDNNCGFVLRSPAEARQLWATHQGHQGSKVCRLAAQAYADLRYWTRADWDRAQMRAAALTDQREGGK